MHPLRSNFLPKNRLKGIKNQIYTKKSIDDLNEMNEMKESHNEFIDYLENLDETIKKVLSRHKTLIKGRYLSALQHLEKVRKNLVVYQDKMLVVQKEINDDETIKNTLKQIDNFQGFYQILQEKLVDLDGAIDSKETESLTLLEKMRDKKNLLLQVHQENIKLSAKILSYKKNFPLKNEPNDEKKEKREKREKQEKREKREKYEKDSAQLNLKIIQKEFTALKYETENIMADNHLNKADLAKKSNYFFQMKNLLHESFIALNRNLLFSQQVTNQTGLKNSLLFKINKMPSMKPEMSRTLVQFKQYDKKTFSQDREIKNVVYSTLEKVVKDRKNKKKEFLEEIEVPWDEFKKFSPLQIMGLISMHSLIGDSIFDEFEKKDKNINEFLNKMKIM